MWQDFDDPPSKADNDNHSNQLNPNNDAYWQSRSYEDRPEDWEEQSSESQEEDS